LPKFPEVNSIQLIKILEQEGFKVIRQKALHSGKDIKPGLLRAILKEAGINREEFFKLLKEK
jgi:predicted RNA binding protein YcfA (HicA-like mRNA interferase family)